MLAPASGGHNRLQAAIPALEPTLTRPLHGGGPGRGAKRDGMSDWIDVLGRDELPTGRNVAVHLDDGTEIALFDVGGEVLCTDNKCVHAGGPLGYGYFEGETVTCPWHGWQFCVRTGACLDVPGQGLHRYPVRVEGDRIQVRLVPLDPG